MPYPAWQFSDVTDEEHRQSSTCQFVCIYCVLCVLCTHTVQYSAFPSMSTYPLNRPIASQLIVHCLLPLSPYIDCTRRWIALTLHRTSFKRNHCWWYFYKQTWNVTKLPGPAFKVVANNFNSFRKLSWSFGSRQANFETIELILKSSDSFQV